MTRADLAVCGCRQLLTCAGTIPKRGKDLMDVGLLEGAWIASREGRIVFIGNEHRFRREVRMEEGGRTIRADGLVGLPGFVDPHTHLPFAGNRSREFVLRLQGATYLELAAKGMGIQTTVKATRQATEEELLDLCLARLDSMLRHGTTTAEAKSGYGLNLEDELKQLRVLRRADAVHPVDLVPTFLGAHEIPPEYRDRKSAYIELLIREILPRVKEERLAEFFDVFCEEGVYSVEETRDLIRRAKEAGLKARIHADEFATGGGAELAVEEQAVSADHLNAVSEEGIAALARSDTVALLLPGVSFFLMHEKKPPSRRLIDEGAVVALATDFNPGSSMTESMPFILQLAVYTLKMQVEEAVNAATANASYALERHEQVGSLEVGKKMDLVLCDIPDYFHLAYHMGVNPVTVVIKNGRIAVDQGNVIRR